MRRDQYEEPSLFSLEIRYGRAIEEGTYRKKPLVQDQQREREQYQEKKAADHTIHKYRLSNEGTQRFVCLAINILRKCGDLRSIIWQHTEYLRHVDGWLVRTENFLRKGGDP